MASVELKNLTKIYSNNTVVDSINLLIKDKEFIVLVGPSGCGKTTTLRMIAGLEDISKGELYIGNKLVNDYAPKDRDIAMVFQNYALYPHMTTFENMAFGLKLRRLSKEYIKKSVLEAANILDIENLLDRKPKAMSGGQRQRVAIGRAIVRNPEVFLFDEPLSNLDAKLRVQMRIEIARLHKKLNTTMIYVTHDQVEAMTLGERIVVMKDGIIHQHGTPSEIYNNPLNKFVAGFIGTPPMNFINGKITDMSNDIMFKDEFGDFTLIIKKSNNPALISKLDQKITVGIRPEDIHYNIKEDSRYQSFKSETLLVEKMGHEVYVFVENGQNQITARLLPDSEIKAGDMVDLYIDSHKLHFFDFKTEYSIR